MGIIGGTGLDNPDILSNRTEKHVTTPFGEVKQPENVVPLIPLPLSLSQPSDCLISGNIQGTPCILLSRSDQNLFFGALFFYNSFLCVIT